MISQISKSVITLKDFIDKSTEEIYFINSINFKVVIVEVKDLQFNKLNESKN